MLAIAPSRSAGSSSRKRADQQVGQVAWGEVLGPHLHDAWAFRAGRRQHRTEVEVVGEDDAAVRPGSLHEDPIARPRVADGGPVHRLEAVALERRTPLGREVHVDQELHEPESATSVSSSRHAA